MTRRALLAAAFLAAAASAGAELRLGTAVVGDVYLGTVRVCAGYLGDALVHQVGTPPVVTRFTTDHAVLVSTSDRRVVLTWTVTGATQTRIDRIEPDGTATTIRASSGVLTSTENIVVPGGCGSAGCRYVLHALNSGETGCSRDATADLQIRIYTPPTLTAFAASAPAGHQSPFLIEQCSTLTWTSTAGDPPAAWSITQSGPVLLQHLPSPQRSGPGSSPQRVCYTSTASPGANTTTLVLTGTSSLGSEAHAVSREATITWAGS